jgi:D-3-phosphoglycerate dehydrogenase / 2-oxoglutarate reductase
MRANKVLIACPQFKGRRIDCLDRLRDSGLEPVMNDSGHVLSEDELIASLPGVFATMAHGEIYSERVFAAAPDLRVVARFGVGHDRVDVPAATRHGVAVAMAYGTNHESVADYAFALAIALSCSLFPHHRMVLDGAWGFSRHHGMWGSTVGLVGLGRIGKAMARRCQAFAMPVLAYDPALDAKSAADLGITRASLDELLATSDIVSLHLPLLPSTRGLIGSRELALMKTSAILINTARGGLIDEHALAASLREGRLAGAGLDTFASEPPTGSPLLTCPNVILSPHTAASDLRTEALMGNKCIDHILAVWSGAPPDPACVLNPESLRRA